MHSLLSVPEDGHYMTAPSRACHCGFSDTMDCELKTAKQQQQHPFSPVLLLPGFIPATEEELGQSVPLAYATEKTELPSL